MLLEHTILALKNKTFPCQYFNHIYEGVPKICHIYLTTIKRDSYTILEENPRKYINHVTKLLGSADISIFFTRNQQFLLFQEIEI